MQIKRTGKKENEQNIVLLLCQYINKGTEFLHAVELLGIGLENIVAFGDMSNDNPMLELAGIVVCQKMVHRIQKHVRLYH